MSMLRKRVVVVFAVMASGLRDAWVRLRGWIPAVGVGGGRILWRVGVPVAAVVTIVLMTIGGGLQAVATASRAGIAAVADGLYALADLDYLSNDRLPGFLHIEAPQVYTRERLVNDRFRLASWLTAELERTEERADEGRFLVPANVRERMLALSAALGKPELATEGAAGAVPSPLQLDPHEVFERRLSYRNEVSGELMNSQLDDAHDLAGNTLYRLNFEAAVLPWVRSRAYPGSAVFLVTARSPYADDIAEGKKAEGEGGAESYG